MKTRTKHSSLDQITDWEARTLAAHFNIEVMAANCATSTRQLQRHFVSLFGIPPKQWVRELRDRLARTKATHGDRSKSIAADLDYKQSSHFCKAFKSAGGTTKKEY